MNNYLVFVALFALIGIGVSNLVLLVLFEIYRWLRQYYAGAETIQTAQLPGNSPKDSELDSSLDSALEEITIERNPRFYSLQWPFSFSLLLKRNFPKANDIPFHPSSP